MMPALALMAIITVWVAAMTLRPRPGDAIAAFFPPLTSRDATLAGASLAGDSEIVAFGNVPWIIVVRSEDPDLAKRLRAAGAWLTVRAPSVGGCFR